MRLSEIGHWWNLIFVIPFAVGLVMVLLSIFGAGDDGDATDGAGADGSDLDMGDADFGGEGDAGDNETRGGSLVDALHLRNIPTLMLVQNFLLFWGVCGWTANLAFGKGATEPRSFIVISVLAGMVGGLVLTVSLSATLARFTPGDESSAVRKSSLVGRVGEAVSPITERMGSVYVRDGAGTLHHLAVRVQADGEPIAKGEQVLVIDYLAGSDHYWVKKWTI